jgi:hypothetical protein
MCRSVEVLGFHHAEREVRILLGFYVEKKMEAGAENYLRLMHRGNVECFVQPAWPLPLHPDEVKYGSSVLRDIYAENFQEQEHDNHLLHVKTLTAWDARIPVAQPHPVVPWSPKIEGDPVKDWGWKLMPETPALPLEQYVPFTTWLLGPFDEPAPYLITCAIRIAHKTYDELVESKPQFTVDGPERLLSRIKYDDVFRLADQERAEWEGRLAPFEQSHLLLGDGYDVIILNPPLADSVERLNGSIGIVPAPRQPGRERGERFMTADQAFNMTLRYARSEVEKADQETVLHC